MCTAVRFKWISRPGGLKFGMVFNKSQTATTEEIVVTDPQGSRAPTPLGPHEEEVVALRPAESADRAFIVAQHTAATDGTVTAVWDSSPLWGACVVIHRCVTASDGCALGIHFFRTLQMGLRGPCERRGSKMTLEDPLIAT
jgi:hypothetical protein